MRETSVRGRLGFFGRETELAALDAALARAARFQAPQTVTVVGALGFGKTRLVDEWLATKATADLRVVRAGAVKRDREAGAGPEAPLYGRSRACPNGPCS